MVICAAFGQDWVHVFTRKMDAGVLRHIQSRGSVSGVQPNERVCIPRGERQPQCRSVHRGHRRIRNAWCSFRKYTPELYDRPSAPLELKIRMLRAEVIETMLYGCVTLSPRACHYDTLRRAHQRFMTRCIGWRRHNLTDHPISYLDTLIETGSESIEATVRRRRILVTRFVARMEDTKLPKCVMFGELVRGAGCVRLCEGSGERVDEVFPGRPQSFRHQRRPVDNCSSGQGGWRRTAKQGVEHFMAKWIAAEKARAGLRHAVLCPNVTGRTKERTAQSKRARPGPLAILD